MDVTTWVIVVVVGGTLAVDLGLVLARRSTISQRIWEWSKRWPVVPFAFGCLMGHFFL